MHHLSLSSTPFLTNVFDAGCFLSSRIKALILEHKGSLVLELQQRAIEFGSILTKHNDIKFVLLLPYIYNLFSLLCEFDNTAIIRNIMFLIPAVLCCV